VPLGLIPSPGGEPRQVERSSLTLPARAWWDDQLVAESAGALRVEEDGQPPALYFPTADVRFEHFRDEGHRVTCPVKGTARLWSAGGQDVLWAFTEPSPACAWLAGYASFDHDRVRVELIDGRPGDPARDVTVKRFPNWGDAAHLIDLLDVRRRDEHHYVGATRADWRRPVVEGSQMLGQAIVAASRYSHGRRPVSAHMVFTRAADSRRPLDVELDEVAHGRTVTALTVRIGQDENRPCATGTILLDVTAPDVIRHAVAPPDGPGPYGSVPYDMSVTGRDVRIVDGAYTGDAQAPIGPPVLDAWVRFRDVPDEPCLHAALLAQFTGHLSIAAALRPHAGVGQEQAHRTLSTAINAIAVSFHADVHADQWMRYRHHSTFAGDGMTHAECRVHDEAGSLLASFTVDAMVRGFAPERTAIDDRTAL
jgi:acyl-CoA thioesterase II